MATASPGPSTQPRSIASATASVASCVPMAFKAAICSGIGRHAPYPACRRQRLRRRGTAAASRRRAASATNVRLSVGLALASAATSPSSSSAATSKVERALGATEGATAAAPESRKRSSCSGLMLGIWSRALSPSIARHPLATDHPQPIACVAALAALATDLTRDLTAPIATTSVYELPHRSEPLAAVLEVQKGVWHNRGVDDCPRRR